LEEPVGLDRGDEVSEVVPSEGFTYVELAHVELA
jgi:hypothetical protein